jgi:hypothetical protein
MSASGKIEVGEKIEEMWETLSDQVDENYLNLHLPPFAMIFGSTPDDPETPGIGMVPMPFRSDIEKDLMSAAVRDICREMRADGVGFVSKIYLLRTQADRDDVAARDILPSQHENVLDGLLITLEVPGQVVMLQQEIRVDEAGKRYLEPIEDRMVIRLTDKDSDVGGRFSRWLPQNQASVVGKEPDNAALARMLQDFMRQPNVVQN